MLVEVDAESARDGASMSYIQKMNEAQQEVNRFYSRALYEMATKPLPFPFGAEARKRTRIEKLRDRFANFRERCLDAWLVLKGEAHISDEDY